MGFRPQAMNVLHTYERTWSASQMIGVVTKCLVISDDIFFFLQRNGGDKVKNKAYCIPRWPEVSERINITVTSPRRLSHLHKCNRDKEGGLRNCNAPLKVWVCQQTGAGRSLGFANREEVAVLLLHPIKSMLISFIPSPTGNY